MEDKEQIKELIVELFGEVIDEAIFKWASLQKDTLLTQLVGMIEDEKAKCERVSGSIFIEELEKAIEEGCEGVCAGIQESKE